MANNWAIAVGINHYEFLPEASLSFAAQDALAMRQFLCAEAGFQEKQVLLCGDSPEGNRKATRPVLRDILLNKLEHAKNADNLWFFFGGHGAVGSDRQDYLLTSDSNPQDLHDTAIPINFVTDRLRACKAKNIVLVLDMCRSERLQTGERGLESMEDSVRQLVQDREDQQGIITLFSCGRGQSSYEIAELQQGAFTYALLEGLRQHSILKDLEKFLEKRVPELHQLHRASGQTRRQVPLVISEPASRYLEPILSHYATAVDVSRLKEMAIDAECDLDFEKALQLWEQVNLLATNTIDRQRALNRIRDLMGRLSQSPTTVEPMLEIEPSPSPKSPRSPVQPVAVPTLPHGIDAVPLDSDKSVDYHNLRGFLRAGRWKEADEETLEVMLKAANRESDGWLDSDSVKNFPCQDLKTIDLLWMTASNGHFGFSVQKKIWDECGSPISYDDDRETFHDKWETFSDRVGWRREGCWLNYSELKFASDIDGFDPAGELPIYYVLGFGRKWGGINSQYAKREFSSLSERLVNCSTTNPCPSVNQTFVQLVAAPRPQQPQDIDAVPLESEKGVDYSTLQDLLKAGQWREADKETRKVMLKASNRESEGWLDSDSLKNFPCKDLRTIDQLWVTASNGHFGFSIQKKIWEKCGSPVSYNDDWRKFGNAVGWLVQGEWVKYSDLKFASAPNGNSPSEGELPLWGVLERYETRLLGGSLFSRKDF
jgi:GUN4-like/Caspase domain